MQVPDRSRAVRFESALKKAQGRVPPRSLDGVLGQSLKKPITSWVAFVLSLVLGTRPLLVLGAQY